MGSKKKIWIFLRNWSGMIKIGFFFGKKSVGYKEEIGGFTEKSAEGKKKFGFLFE